MELIRKAFQMDNPLNDWRITLGNHYLDAYFDEMTKFKKENKELQEKLKWKP